MIFSFSYEGQTVEETVQDSDSVCLRKQMGGLVVQVGPLPLPGEILAQLQIEGENCTGWVKPDVSVEIYADSARF